VEDEARAQAETAGSKKVIKITKEKYLVKWIGMSYRECTWETAEDINDDAKVSDFWKGSQVSVRAVQPGHVSIVPRPRHRLPSIRSPNVLQDCDAETYAQIIASSFLKYSVVPPDALLKECGPATFAFVHGRREALLLPASLKGIQSDMNTLDEPGLSYIQLTPATEPLDTARQEVTATVADLAYAVSRGMALEVYPRTALLPSGYVNREIYVAKGSSSLFMKIGLVLDLISVVGFQPFEDNKLCALEASGAVNIGDILVAVDGECIFKQDFKDVVSKLKSKKPLMKLHFLHDSEKALNDGGGEDATSIDPATLEAIKIYLDALTTHQSSKLYPERSACPGVCAKRVQNSVVWEAVVFDQELNEISLGSYVDESDAIGKRNKHSMTTINNYAVRAVEGEMNINDKIKAELAATACVPSDTNIFGDDNASLDSLDSDSDLTSMGSSDSEDEEEWIDVADEAEHLIEWDKTSGKLTRLHQSLQQSEVRPDRALWDNYLLGLSHEAPSSGSKRLQQIDPVTQSVLEVWDSADVASARLCIPLQELIDAVDNPVLYAGGFTWTSSNVNTVNCPALWVLGLLLLLENFITCCFPQVEKRDRSWSKKLYQTSKHYKNDGLLRDYQVNGLNWLLSCWYCRRSSILADEMGNQFTDPVTQ
jgi:hypothetical protein